MSSPVRPVLIFCGCLLGSVACGTSKSASPRPGGSAEPGPSSTTAAAPADPRAARVLARVNGVELTELDVQQRARATGHGAPAGPTPPAAVLETVIRDELTFQRAVELGLDRDPGYQKKLLEMKAQLRAFERREMADLFFQREVRAKAAVPDHEAKQYFDQNASQIRAELHVWQLLFPRDEASARQALAEIRGGAAFETVAKKRFPNLPPGAKSPWDLGFLRYSQLPEPWLPVVFQLSPGDVSDVIRSEDGRFWVIRLVERRDNPKLTFEEAKPRIVAVLERRKTEERRAAVLQELKDRATISYADGAAPEAPR